MPTLERLLEATSRAEQDHFWFRGFRRFVRPLLAEAVAGVARPRILDCGFGTGVNLKLLSEFGQVWGVDLTWAGIERARRAGHQRVAQATVTSLPFPDGAFDVVASFDVLYCLDDPEEAPAVVEMSRVLRAGGAAVVNVAAMEILRGNHSVLAGEVRRYSRARLRRLLEGSDFEIVRMTYTNAALFPLVLTVRAAQRLVGLAPADRAGREMTVPAAPVNAMLSAALALEAQALRWIDMPFGSSLLCLARKKCLGGARPDYLNSGTANNTPPNNA